MIQHQKYLNQKNLCHTKNIWNGKLHRKLSLSNSILCLLLDDVGRPIQAVYLPFHVSLIYFNQDTVLKLLELATSHPVEFSRSCLDSSLWFKENYILYVFTEAQKHFELLLMLYVVVKPLCIQMTAHSLRQVWAFEINTGLQDLLPLLP